MKTIPLDTAQASTISNALRVAAERYKESADTMDNVSKAHAEHPMMTRKAAASLAEQFRRQRVDALALMEDIDAAYSIIIKIDED